MIYNNKWRSYYWNEYNLSNIENELKSNTFEYLLMIIKINYTLKYFISSNILHNIMGQSLNNATP
jgi:hypothetical protein